MLKEYYFPHTYHKEQSQAEFRQREYLSFVEKFCGQSRMTVDLICITQYAVWMHSTPKLKCAIGNFIALQELLVQSMRNLSLLQGQIMSRKLFTCNSIFSCEKYLLIQRCISSSQNHKVGESCCQKHPPPVSHILCHKLLNLKEQNIKVEFTMPKHQLINAQHKCNSDNLQY